MKKTRSRKSRDTVPLKGPFLERDIVYIKITQSCLYVMMVSDFFYWFFVIFTRTFIYTYVS
jgi:hypothetical protein